MAEYPIHGKVVKPESIDEREKLVRRNTVNLSPQNWHLVNFISFFHYQNEAIQATISDLLDAIGLKLINANIDINATYTFLPNYAGYVPKNRERVLLIAQTNTTQNGVYEYSTSTQQFTRIFDWRDVVAGNGININNQNLAVKLWSNIANLLQFNGNGELYLKISPNSHPALKKEVGSGDLFLDPAELTGGGGATLLDVPHPDIHNVTGDTVLLPIAQGSLSIQGGNFRRDASVFCQGFSIVNFNTRKSNQIVMAVEASNLIGTHDILVKHLVLDSADTGKHSFTVLGAAVIDTVSPFAKRNQTITMTVTGEGFAFLSAFAANNAGITINLLQFIDRFNVLISVTCDNTVNSGTYNLLCTNSFGGNTFDSGTSGDNKLIVSGAPFIAALIENIFFSVQRPEVGIGQTATFRIQGFDLTNEVTINPTAQINLDTISLIDTENIDITVTGVGTIAEIGKKNLLVFNSNTGEDSGTSGNNLMGLNYPYDRFGNILPFLIRPYGGTTDVNDWNLVINGGSTGVNISKTGGSGWCYVEFTDAWFAKSVIDNSYGNILSFVEGFISTLAPDLGETGEVLIALAPAGLNLTSSVVDLSLTAAYIKYEKNRNTSRDLNSYAVRYRGELSPWGYFIGDSANKFGLHLQASLNQLNITDIRQKGGASANSYNPDDVNWFPIWASQPLPNGSVVFGSSSNPKLSVYIGMNGNFAISDLRMRGLVGY